MKFISWNIDSLNAALTHSSARGEITYQVLKDIAKLQPDFFSIQEPKIKLPGLTDKQIQQLQILFPDYEIFANPSTQKSGYAGTMILTKHHPDSVNFEKIGAIEPIDTEGRILTLEYTNFYLSTVYTPNSGNELKRLPQRIDWDKKYQQYLSRLSAKKPVVTSGDYNVAHQEIDLKNPNNNHKSAGFTDEERDGFTKLLESGFIDTWRSLNPTTTDFYTWWAQISKTSKLNNTGWRIDYYLVSSVLKDRIKNSGTLGTGERRDHAPITLELDIAVK